MRKQIRGLDQHPRTQQDGISAVQTAEGALNEVQDMLQRMNELAVQAANGTNSTSDRQSIQDEIDQLATEIDRVSETTKFNEAYLLKGDSTAPKKFSFSYAEPSETGVPAEVDMTGDGDSTGTDTATQLTLEVTFDGDAPQADQNALAIALRDQGYFISKEIVDDGTGNGTPNPAERYDLKLNGEVAKNYTVNVTDPASGTFEIMNAKGTKVADVTVNGGTVEANDAGDVGKCQSAVITARTVTMAAVDGSNAVQQYYDKDGNAISANALKDYFTARDDDGTVVTYVKAGKQLYDAVGKVVDMATLSGNVNGNTNDVVATQNLVGDLKLKLHVGADATSNNQITINLQAMSARGLGVNGLKVDGSDDTNARNAIETIKSALSTVSAQRSELGAVQNRLEHTIANLDNIVENTTSAESAIRDTDMAEEMVKYSKSNILAQAGQSMLAQANQSNQGVLSLLG